MRRASPDWVACRSSVISSNCHQRSIPRPRVHSLPCASKLSHMDDTRFLAGEPMADPYQDPWRRSGPPTMPRSKRLIASSQRSCIPTATRTTQRRRSGSARSPTRMTYCPITTSGRASTAARSTATATPPRRSGSAADATRRGGRSPRRGRGRFRVRRRERRRVRPVREPVQPGRRAARRRRRPGRVLGRVRRVRASPAAQGRKRRLSNCRCPSTTRQRRHRSGSRWATARRST